MKSFVIPLMLLQAVTFGAPQSSNGTGQKPQTASSQNQRIVVKQAYYGPSWGHYSNLSQGIRSYCGDNSSYCEVFCPGNSSFTDKKRCRIVYSCDEKTTKSTEARSGDVIVMDCRNPN